MVQPIRMTVAIMLTAFLVTSLSLVSNTPVVASEHSQGAPPLNGIQILFSEANREASPFDRSDEGLSRFAGVLQNLGAEIFSVDWRRSIPSNTDLVIVGGPLRDLDADQIARLWVYLSGGGSALIMAEPFEIEESDDNFIVDPSRALPSERDLFELMWNDYGIRARDDVLLGAEAQQLLEQEFGDLIGEDELNEEETDEESEAAGVVASALAVARSIAEFTTDDRNTEHPISANIDGELFFFGARSVAFDASLQQFSVAPLIFNRAGFYGETDYDDFIDTAVLEFNEVEDTPPGEVAVAAVAENFNTGGRIIIIGDREFATNGAGLQTSPPNSANFVYPANLLFLINSVAWLVDVDVAGLEQQLNVPAPEPPPATMNEMEGSTSESQ